MPRTSVLRKSVSAVVTASLKATCASLLILAPLACNALLGVLFMTDFCDRPGACGASGQLLRSFPFGISEIVPQFGEGGYINHITVGAEGVAFADTSEGLRLYVAAGDGLRIYDGRTHQTLLDTIVVRECTPMGDVVVLEDGTLIVNCITTGRLVKIDPGRSEVVESYSCCTNQDEPFDPLSLALAPDGTVLAGTREINVFDEATGGFLGVAVEPGVEGATSYNDFTFGPNGNLFVSANPDVGVLQFDGESFEFLGVFVPGGDEGVPMPGALAFATDGNLFAGSTQGTLLLEFDGQTGEQIREVVDEGHPADVISHMAFRP